jgi:hypothetical protein
MYVDTCDAVEQCCIHVNSMSICVALKERLGPLFFRRAGSPSEKRRAIIFTIVIPLKGPPSLLVADSLIGEHGMHRKSRYDSPAIIDEWHILIEPFSVPKNRR